MIKYIKAFRFKPFLALLYYLICVFYTTGSLLVYLCDKIFN